jgi:hypothetical protein
MEEKGKSAEERLIFTMSIINPLNLHRKEQKTYYKNKDHLL